MMFTIEIYKTDKRKKSGERLIGKYDFDRKDMESMNREVSALYPTYKESNGYRFEVHQTFVTRTNMMGGGQFEERYDTPSYCSPSSESYWSM